MGKKFKILSIDGGGFRGVYSAHILKRIESEFDINWLDEFDLIAGTSTGSIIAASLAIGKKAGEVLELYKTHGRDIFNNPFPKWGILFSKYSKKNLSKILKSFFNDIKLGDIAQPLIIPTTDIANGCVHVMKSTFHNEFYRDKDVFLSEAVLASCSAPTYFKPTLLEGDKPYLLADGGLWANSPCLVAAIEARKRLNADFKDLKILSIGTGNSNLFYSIKEYKKRKIFGWGFVSGWKRDKFIKMLLNLQSQNANNMLGLVLEEEQIRRVNFDSDVDLALDAPNEFDDLVSRADKQFSHESALIKNFLSDRGD